MVAVTLLSIIWAALTPLTLATKANITYPATIEIDLLSPQNTTYNRNLNYPPIVFAIQNAQAAYAYEWSIHYLIYGATDSADAIPVIRGTAKSQLDENEFQYYVADVAIAPMPIEGALISLKNGAFRLEWDYATTPCIPEGKTSIYQQRTPFASGVSYFSIVEKEGLDFDEIPVGGACPSFGASWELETKKSCPGDKKAVGSGGKGDPCKARLTSQKQVDCIWEFVSKGKNESETCLSAFERVDPDWPKYYTPGRGGFDNDNDDEGEDGGGSGSNGTDTSSGDSTGSSTDPKEDAGTSLRPVISGMVLAVLGAVVMAL
ncbi:hypothetical protein V492_02601 [Pseudogymnoascus sp. VKM F-4246]|nr:hypothetical protein V492_02601 [Pseudogymnoascus sp. VKM F-4246]